MANKLRVGVFISARSIEGEVSFNSGRTICDHLDTSLFEAIPIFQDQHARLFILPLRFLHRGKISDFAHRLESEATAITWDDLPTLIDFVYIAAHGRYVEDGQLQGMLTMLQIPYLGSKVFASALGMDKALQKDFLTIGGIATAKGIVIPATIACHASAQRATIMQQLSNMHLRLPLVVKPHNEGSSLGTTIVHTEEELLAAITRASSITPGCLQAVIVEEKLTGMEFTCIVLRDIATGKQFALPPTEVIPEAGTEFFDYAQKYMPGRAHQFTPARCSATTTAAIQEQCLRTAQILGMTTLARIDGFVTDDGRIVIIDPNSFSGMGPAQFIFRQAAQINMSHTELINHLIASELAIQGLAQPAHTTMATTEKLRVAVIMGGRSNEKEISLESGRNICYKLSPEKYTVMPLFLNSALRLYAMNQAMLVSHSTAEIELALLHQESIPWSVLPTVADFVFIALHGGEGENGTIQGTLQTLSLPYNGSGIITSALCMDKFKTNTLLAHKGFHVPRNIFVLATEWQQLAQEITTRIAQQIGWPVIVKPHDDGCSVMVSKVRNAEELAAALAMIFAHGKEGALIEEFVQGMELTIGVVGNDQYRALPPSYAVSSQEILSIEEKFLPGAGENQTPAPLSPAATALAQRTIEELFAAVGGSGYARIDCFYQSAEQSPTGTERIVIIEINTLPGMTPATCIFHQAAELGIKPMDFIDLIVQLGLQKHRNITEETIAAWQQQLRL